jgi:hypothetical protein
MNHTALLESDAVLRLYLIKAPSVCATHLDFTNVIPEWFSERFFEYLLRGHQVTSSSIPSSAFDPHKRYVHPPPLLLDVVQKPTMRGKHSTGRRQKA